jgi:hypothetical protein
MHKNRKANMASSSQGSQAQVQGSRLDDATEEKENIIAWLQACVEKQAADLEDLQVTLDQTITALQKEQVELDHFKHMNSNRQQEITKLHNQLRAQDEEIKKFRLFADRRARESDDLRGMVVERDKRILALSQENEHLKRTEIVNLQNQLRIREQEIQKLQSVGKELDAYRDAYSKAEQTRRTLQEETATLRRKAADTNNRLYMKPYAGLSRKLILGIDVGTTFSGVSYSILDPGVVPTIHGVNRWVDSAACRIYHAHSSHVYRYPAQEKVGGDAKIPSIIYYDQQGIVRAVGAEALLESNIERAYDENWIKVEW